MKTSELKGALLDHWVARANGWTLGPQHKILECDVWRDNDGCIVGTIPAQAYRPSTDWSQGGPIIEREMIELIHDRDWREDGEFGRVWQGHDAAGGFYDGDTPLIAAMRSYVAAKFGHELPEAGAAPAHPGEREKACN